MQSDSIVLEEEIDPNYEPTDQEVVDYARWLGMNLDTDKDLMWIAREGLKAPLPESWKPCKTIDTEEIYYFNFANGESTWDHPCDQYYRSLYDEEKRRRTSYHNSQQNSATMQREKDEVRHIVTSQLELNRPRPGSSREITALDKPRPGKVPGASFNGKNFNGKAPLPDIKHRVKNHEPGSAHHSPHERTLRGPRTSDDFSEEESDLDGPRHHDVNSYGSRNSSRFVNTARTDDSGLSDDDEEVNQFRDKDLDQPSSNSIKSSSRPGLNHQSAPNSSKRNLRGPASQHSDQEEQIFSELQGQLSSSLSDKINQLRDQHAAEIYDCKKEHRQNLSRMQSELKADQESTLKRMEAAYQRQKRQLEAKSEQEIKELQSTNEGMLLDLRRANSQKRVELEKEAQRLDKLLEDNKAEYQAEIERHTNETDRLADRERQLAERRQRTTSEERELSSITRRVQDANEELTDVQKELDRVQRLIAAKTQQLDDLSDELENKAKESAEESADMLKRAMEEAERKVAPRLDALRSQNDDLEREAKQLRRDRESASDLREENDRLTREIAELEGQLSRGEANEESVHSKLRTEISELHAQLRDLKAKMRASADELETASAAFDVEREDFESRIAQLEGKTSELTDLLADSERQKVELEERVPSLEEEKDRLKQVISDLRQEQSDGPRTDSDLGDHDGQLDELRNMNNDLESELERVRVELDSAREASRAELVKLQTERDKMSETVRQLEQGDSDALRELENQLSNARTDLESLREQHAADLDQLVLEQRRCEIFQQELKALREEGESGAAEAAQVLSSRIMALEEEVRVAREEARELAADHERARRAEQDAAEMAKELQEKLGQRQSECDKLRDEIEQAESSRSGTSAIQQSEIDRLKRERQDALTKLADEEIVKRTIEDELQVSNHKVGALDEQVRLLRDREIQHREELADAKQIAEEAKARMAERDRRIESLERRLAAAELDTQSPRSIGSGSSAATHAESMMTLQLRLSRALEDQRQAADTHRNEQEALQNDIADAKKREFDTRRLLREAELKIEELTLAQEASASELVWHKSKSDANRAQLDELKEACKAAEQEKAELWAKVERLEAQVRQSDEKATSSLTQAQQSQQEVETQIRELSAERQSLRTQLRQVKVDLETAHADGESLRQEADAAQARVRGAEKEKRELHTLVKNLEMERELLERFKEDFEKERGRWTAKERTAAQVMQQLQEAQDFASQLEAEKRRLVQRVSLLEAQLSRQNDDLEKLTGEGTDQALQKAWQDARAERTRIDLQSTALESRQRELDELEARLKAEQSALEKLRDELEVRRRDLDREQAQARTASAAGPTEAKPSAVSLAGAGQGILESEARELQLRREREWVASERRRLENDRKQFELDAKVLWKRLKQARLLHKQAGSASRLRSESRRNSSSTRRSSSSTWTARAAAHKNGYANGHGGAAAAAAQSISRFASKSSSGNNQVPGKGASHGYHGSNDVVPMTAAERLAAWARNAKAEAKTLDQAQRMAHAQQALLAQQHELLGASTLKGMDGVGEGGSDLAGSRVLRELQRDAEAHADRVAAETAEVNAKLDWVKRAHGLLERVDAAAAAVEANPGSDREMDMFVRVHREFISCKAGLGVERRWSVRRESERGMGADSDSVDPLLREVGSPGEPGGAFPGLGLGLGLGAGRRVVRGRNRSMSDELDAMLMEVGPDVDGEDGGPETDDHDLGHRGGSGDGGSSAGGGGLRDEDDDDGDDVSTSSAFGRIMEDDAENESQMSNLNSMAWAGGKAGKSGSRRRVSSSSLDHPSRGLPAYAAFGPPPPAAAAAAAAAAGYLWPYAGPYGPFAAQAAAPPPAAAAAPGAYSALPPALFVDNSGRLVGNGYDARLPLAGLRSERVSEGLTGAGGADVGTPLTRAQERWQHSRALAAQHSAWLARFGQELSAGMTATRPARRASPLRRARRRRSSAAAR